MTQYLPPNLLALFAARDPIPFMPPVDKLPHEKKSRGYLGVAHFMTDFEDPEDTPLPKTVETRQERLERRRREKAEQVAYKLEREIALWDPTEIKNATEDPFRTLFIARINYDTSESKLRREFEFYGPIKKIVLIHDQESGKPKGYAFIEYEHERDMHAAYKHADGKKIDSKRVLVDVERARTVKGWLPRRLGGGLGGTRRGGNDVNIKHSGREDNERERERYRLEREREDREGAGGRSNNGVEPRGAPGGRPAFGADRRRSRSRDRRDRERDRGRVAVAGNRSRSRSRERRKRRAGSRERYDEFDRRDRRERDRERDRDRDRDREREKRKKRSKSRERDSSRERRERKRDRKDRERGGVAGDVKERKPDFREMDIIKIKEEPVDDGYPSFDYQNAAIKREVDDEHEEKYRPPPAHHNMFSVPPPPIIGRNNSNANPNAAPNPDNGQQNANEQSWWRQ
ncbi:U1 small nuclear ribonucleoprotein 70 kDa [Drosophila miranda]|uniref:U1 small nuclear ribonucleoprotein 70 kDa n=1 Tax=Drosophila miranda TaxID=7229 RepID=UPI00006C71FB|nr:U1 small nuclear ribonucleoprotein 70 kDa [Drosophila miranda]XP_026843123.1 U1 small nuclear ribonucleoprotein 70 kDa [Drosophila persimilis]